MKTRALILFAALVAATAGPLLAQTPRTAPQPGPAPRGRTAPDAPQPGTAPRARTAVTPEAAPPLPPPPPAPGGSRRTGQPINIRVEFTLIDQRSGGTPVKRTVSVVVADAHTGQIRSQSDVFGIIGGVPLNIDTSPDLLPDGKVRVGFSLQYDWPAPLDQTSTATGGNPPRGTVMKTAMHDSASLILESGKSMIAAQSADPIGDRQVTVEVKATILK
jgi:hypothetical protein